MMTKALAILSPARPAAAAPNDLSFLAYLDAWLIGGLVLLAAAVIVGKWLWRRCRPPAEPDAYYNHEYDYAAAEYGADNCHTDADDRHPPEPPR